MAHLSLYRRFRPDTFDKMVRQEHVVRILKNQIKTGAVGHAYLFTGPRGTGKTTVARIFARAVNCENPQDGSPCSSCATCRALVGGSLDITEIDAASNNGVNEMRDLREKVQYPPVSGKYKVYIVDEVHMLTDSAFNALLKTLEEPPAHAIFILATTEPQKLPATILSRCMRLDFKLIPEEDLEKHLIRILEEMGKPYEREAVAAIARAGAGSDRDMLSIAEMCIAYGDKLTYEGVTAVLGAADFKQTCVFVRALLHARTGEALAAAEKLLSEGKAVGVLCRDVLELLNRVAVAKTCSGAERLLALPKDLFAEVQALANEADGRAILRATEIFARAETELRFASSPRIAFETAVMRVACPALDADVDSLTVRVRELEEKLAALLQTGVQATTNTSTVQAAPQKAEPPQEDEPYSFPEEEPIFAEAYFSDDVPESAPPAPRSAPKATAPVRVAPAQPKPEQKAVAQVSAPQHQESAATLFGQFMRSLRKTARNGVLFTMCADLEAQIEGNKFILYTVSDAVYRSLSREEHRILMAQALEQIGITDFEVRMRQTEKKSVEDGVLELKRNFSGYPIDIKD